MSVRTKRIGVIIAVQVLCVSVGMWMHHRFTMSSATQAVQAEVWGDFGEWSKELFGTLSTSELERLSQGSIPKSISEEVKRRSTFRRDLTVVDSDWRVLTTTQRYVANDSSDLSVQWLEAEGAPPTAGRVAHGYAKFPDGLHTAIRYELPDGLGFGLLHVDAESIEEHLDRILGSLPVISILAIAWICCLLGTAVFMILARLYEEMDQHRSRSAADTLRQTHDLLRTRDAVIFGLAKLADSRDPETGDHLERISIYSTALAAALRRHPQYRKDITPGFVRLIGISAALHDIGKVGVEDRILRKPAKLTPAEFATMKTHACIGGDCLQEIERRLGQSNFLQMAREIAFAHHENWNGTGYPNGLSGTQIPLSARIVAIADVYDALSSKRVYKDAMSHEECIEIIQRDSGKKFDPEMVEVWFTIESKFRLIAKQLANQFVDVDYQVASRGEATMAATMRAEELCGAFSGNSSLGL